MSRVCTRSCLLLNLVIAESLACTGVAAAPAPSSPPRVFCYVETLFGGVSPEAMDLAVCTHVIEAFLIPEATGAVKAVNGLPRRKLIEAARTRGAGVLVAVGGATVPGATFSALAANPGALRRFSEELSRFVIEGGYDGVDLDWEFPTPTERALQLELVRVVRKRLETDFAARRPGQKPLVLLGVTPGAHLEGYDFTGLAKHVDYFIQFGYDFRNPALGPWAHTAKLWPDGAQQPIEASLRGVATELLRRGVPREKLVLSLPMYSSDGLPWVNIREKALAATAPVDPLFLESNIEGVWVTGPAALEAKARKVVGGSEIAGGSAAGVAVWQLGHQGPFRDLTDALRRALPPSAAHGKER